MYYNFKLEDHQFFANELVRKVAAWNQSASVNIVGNLGLGKSHTGIRLCMQCAEIKAQKYGGVWQDYFNLNQNMGVADMDEVIRVNHVISETKGQIFLLDDISISHNARKFGSTENQNFNAMMTIGRTHKHIIVRTFPHNFMIDKYVRHLSNYLVEMQKPYFSLSYTSAKVFAIEQQRDGSDPHEVYLQNRFGEKYMRAFFRDPPKEIIQIYDEIREKAMRNIERKALESLANNEQESKVPKLKKGDIYRQIYQEFIEGKYGQMSLKEICRQKNVGYQQVCNVANQQKIKQVDFNSDEVIKKEEVQNN